MARILTIDGGGIKGVFAASFLKEIEEKCDIRICDYFDMIAGTSTGAIIAAALSVGVPAAKILNLYIDKSEMIFPKRRKAILKIFGAQYDSKPLYIELSNIFGDIKMGNCLTRLIIPAFNLEEQKTRVFKTAHAQDLRFDTQYKIVDCLMATTAAPTYLRPHNMQGGVFVDGGLGANNPAILAVIEGITRCGWDKEEISILSVGGIEEAEGGTRGTEKMGLLDAFYILKTYMKAESQYSENMTRLIVGNDNYLRVNHDAMRNQVALDNVNKKTLITLKNWGINQAQVHLNNIKNKFLAQEKEKFEQFNN